MYIDLARAKSKALVNNTYKQKSSDDNENAIKINRSNSN